MKLCAIQVPYGKNPEETEQSVDFLIRELNECDESIDLILTPEYSNGPGELSREEAFPFCVAHTEKLVEAAVIARVEKKRMALRTVVAVDVKELVYAAKAVDGKKLAE